MKLLFFGLFVVALAPAGCVRHHRQSAWDPPPQLTPVTSAATVGPEATAAPDGCPVLEAVFTEGALDDLYAALVADARGPAPGEINLKGVIVATRARATSAPAAGDHARLYWGGFAFPYQGYPETPKALAAEIRGARDKGAKPDGRYAAAKKLYDAMLAATESQDFAVGIRISHKSTNRGAVVCERSLWDTPYGREEYRCFLYGLVAGSSRVDACVAP